MAVASGAGGSGLRAAAGTAALWLGHAEGLGAADGLGAAGWLGVAAETGLAAGAPAVVGVGVAAGRPAGGSGPGSALPEPASRQR